VIISVTVSYFENVLGSPSAYICAMESRPHIDATGYSFDEFLAFIFAHDFVGEVSKEWYWNTDVTFAPQQFCAHYIQLFRNPEILLERFPEPQLEEGFWSMISGTGWSLPRLLWESDVPFPKREDCVRAMFDLFKHLLQLNLWIPPVRCGGMDCVMTGIVGTDFAKEAARTWKCRMSCSRR
jgi:hypothetical protein